jgi:tRNA threonylcarbamoyladenosine biosynthesis protein TsaE
MIEFISNSLEDTKKSAEYFAQFAKAGQCFALYGGLGFGKTTFSRYFIQSINKSIEEVSSPTFTIVQVYDSDIAEIWHVDCYRLKSEEEFFELGLDEAFSNCIIIIEWPEIIEHLLPRDTIKICFSFDNNTRKIFSCF